MCVHFLTYRSHCGCSRKRVFLTARKNYDRKRNRGGGFARASNTEPLRRNFLFHPLPWTTTVNPWKSARKPNSDPPYRSLDPREIHLFFVSSPSRDHHSKALEICKKTQKSHPVPVALVLGELKSCRRGNTKKNVWGVLLYREAAPFGRNTP